MDGLLVVVFACMVGQALTADGPALVMTDPNEHPYSGLGRLTVGEDHYLCLQWFAQPQGSAPIGPVTFAGLAHVGHYIQAPYVYPGLWFSQGRQVQTTHSIFTYSRKADAWCLADGEDVYVADKNLDGLSYPINGPGTFAVVSYRIDE